VSIFDGAVAMTWHVIHSTKWSFVGMCSTSNSLHWPIYFLVRDVLMVFYILTIGPTG
jgi:hypothetical protein